LQVPGCPTGGAGAILAGGNGGYDPGGPGAAITGGSATGPAGDGLDAVGGTSSGFAGGVGGRFQGGGGFNGGSAGGDFTGGNGGPGGSGLVAAGGTGNGASSIGGRGGVFNGGSGNSGGVGGVFKGGSGGTFGGDGIDVTSGSGNMASNRGLAAHFYGRVYLDNSPKFGGGSLSDGGLTFPDSTIQVTAGLPLTGGTLTGALNGTTATFTGAVTSVYGDLVTIGGNLDLPGTSATSGGAPATGVINLENRPFIHECCFNFSDGFTNTFVGLAAGNFKSALTGEYNTATGLGALDSISGGANNTADGVSALQNNTTGGFNTAIGVGALFANVSGSYNTAVGSAAGANPNTLPVAGSNITFIGASASATVDNLTNATAIGFGAQVGESNALVLGGTGANAVNVGIGTTTPGATLHVSGVDAVGVSYPMFLQTNSTGLTFGPSFDSTLGRILRLGDLALTCGSCPGSSNAYDLGIDKQGNFFASPTGIQQSGVTQLSEETLIMTRQGDFFLGGVTGSGHSCFSYAPCSPVATLEIDLTSDQTSILVGKNSVGHNVFRVDDTGKGYFDGGTATTGADFAESVAVRGNRSEYEPGDLLVIDPSGERRLALSQTPYSTLVAGIYSTKPGLLATPHTMDDPAIKTSEVPLAVVGIVACKVTAENGPIRVGDLLVTSSRPGHAMKGTDRSQMLGAVVGKALEPLPEGTGVIQVLVTLQ